MAELINCLEVEQYSRLFNADGYSSSESPELVYHLEVRPESGYVVDVSDFEDYTSVTFPTAAAEFLDTIELTNHSEAYAVDNYISVKVTLHNSVTITQDTDFFVDIGGEAYPEGTSKHWIQVQEEFSELRDANDIQERFPATFSYEEVEGWRHDFNNNGMGMTYPASPNSSANGVYETALDTRHYFYGLNEPETQKVVATITMGMDDNFSPDNENYNANHVYGIKYQGNLDFLGNEPGAITNITTNLGFNYSSGNENLLSIFSSFEEVFDYSGIDNSGDGKFLIDVLPISDGGSEAFWVNTTTGWKRILKKIKFNLIYQEDSVPTYSPQYVNDPMEANEGEPVGLATTLLTDPRRTVFLGCEGERHTKSVGQLPDNNGNVSAVLLQIHNVKTNFGDLHNNSGDDVIPTDGIRDDDKVLVGIYGAPGVTFNVSFRETKFVEIVNNTSRSSLPTLLSAVQLNGGEIPNMPDGKVKIPASGVYVFAFPEVEPLTVTEGWKEFELTVEAGQESSISNSAETSYSELTNPNLPGSILVNAYKQYPKVSILIGGIKSSDWGYETGYNITDVKQYGKQGARKYGVPLSKPKETVEYEVRLTEASTTFTLEPGYVTNYKSNGVDVHSYTWNDTSEMFTPLIKENSDIVKFSPVRVHIGNGLGSTDQAFATVTGSYTVVQFGYQLQTYTIDFTKLFNN